MAIRIQFSHSAQLNNKNIALGSPTKIPKLSLFLVIAGGMTAGVHKGMGSRGVHRGMGTGRLNPSPRASNPKGDTTPAMCA